MVGVAVSLRKRILLGVSLGIVLIGLSVACGKKGTPVPPRQVPPPPVMDLAHELVGDEVTLAWTMPTAGRRATAGVAGFFVYRSKRSISEKECKDCPVLYTRVARVPVEAKEPDTETYTFTEELEAGFHYRYKVTVTSTAGLTSSDSNIVEFTY